MRHEDKALTKRTGVLYRPSFKIKNIKEVKQVMRLHCKPRSYEHQSIAVQQDIIYRVFNFYSYYRELIDWELLDTKGKCIFDWHDDAPCGSLFNYPTDTHPATICCKHATCYNKLSTYCQDILQAERNDGEKNRQKHDIRCETVLYIAAAVLKGIWAIEWVEMCVLKRYPLLINRIDRLQYLRFEAKKDAPSWVKTYHSSALVEPESLQIYDYEENVYKEKSVDSLTHEYEYTIGTYLGIELQKVQKQEIQNHM
jgi:hypothetical protein